MRHLPCFLHNGDSYPEGNPGGFTLVALVAVRVMSGILAAARVMKKKTCLHNQNGAALVYLISAILAMSVLGAAMYQLSTTSTVGGVLVNHLDRTYYLAEAGAAWAYPQVREDIQSNGNFNDDDRINGQTFTLDDANGRNGQFSIAVDVDDSDSDITLLTVTGTIDAAVSGPSETCLVYTMTKTRGGGGGGNGNGGNGETGGITPFSDGICVFGTGAEAGIVMNSKALINGDVATSSGKIEMGREATIDGEIFLNADTNMETIVFDCPDCTDDITISRKKSMDFSEGTYNFNNLGANNSSQINITGDVVINVAGDFTLGTSSRINIASDASLTLIVNSMATFSSKSQVNLNGGSKGNFVILGTENASDIEFKSNSRINGAVYAPNSAVSLKNGVSFTGGMLGNTINMASKSQIKWDKGVENVNTADAYGSSTWRVSLSTQYFQGR